MTEKILKNSDSLTGSEKITVTRDGPFIVSGGVPLSIEEICDDEEGHSMAWVPVKKFPVEKEYALCRCGKSKNKPFCDGTHEEIHFDGTEREDSDPYHEGIEVILGPALTLADNTHLCGHARFCMRAGGIWNLVMQSGNPVARDLAIGQAFNCPTGRLVIHDNATGKTIEPDLEKSIVVIEYPQRREHGPLWVRGGIPVISADGKPYRIRNRVALCRCGRSKNKPFCDGSHVDDNSGTHAPG